MQLKLVTTNRNDIFFLKKCRLDNLDLKEIQIDSLFSIQKTFKEKRVTKKVALYFYLNFVVLLTLLIIFLY